MYDLNKLIETAYRSLMKEYKLKLNNCRVDSGLVGDDILNNYVTLRVTLSR